ncbi:MAG: hypothetical protein QOJ94_153 [Sphingomonadales bacterium]|nr:hypothetical protein [Sphingomonadales bacterium]
MHHTNWYFRILLVLCCGYAWWKGGGPERTVATIYFAGTVLTTLARAATGSWWSSVEASVLGVDVAVLCGLLVVALMAERFWPLWLTALHLLGTAGHLVKMADPTLIRWGYAFIIAVWSYPMLALIVFGTWNHRRRVARFGADRSWSSFSVPSGRRRVAGRTG